MYQSNEIKIALAGNPNSGKTSLFNSLTGSRQKVGNYPGITVESKEGSYKYKNLTFKVLDLPGTYSLTSYSPEEQIAKKELMEKDLKVVVVVADSTNLKRNLFLLTQIMALSVNPVLVLNMSDESKMAGQVIDIKLMSSLLGFSVIETVGHKGLGVDQLKEVILNAVNKPCSENKLELGKYFNYADNQLHKHLKSVNTYPHYWVTLKLLEGDNEMLDWASKNSNNGNDINKLVQKVSDELEGKSGLQIKTLLADLQYGFGRGLLEEVVIHKARDDARETSDLVDKILCNKLLGLPFFFAAMYIIFWATFTIGEIPMGWIEQFFGWLAQSISGIWPHGSDSVLKSLLVDGIIGGVGGVLVFLPNIILLFLGLAFMEDTGYMARAAFLMDRFLHKFGLHGKSFVPLITGFGCSVPGIMATRTIENEKDRLSTMLVLPLISCGARLPIWMLLIPAFFPKENQAMILWTIYIIGIVLALLLAKFLRITAFKGEAAPFVMELPPYRMPTLKAVVFKMWERSKLYLKKAATILLGISIIMWAATSYPQKSVFDIDKEIETGLVKVAEFNIPKEKDEFEIEKIKEKTILNMKETFRNSVRVVTTQQVENIRSSENLEYSVSGRIGKFLEPALKPMGFDWKIGTAIIGAFAAKEVFVAQMGIVFSVGTSDEESSDLRKKLQQTYSPLMAFSLMLFLLISAPCMATIAVTKRESGGWKWALVQLFGLTIIAYIIAVMVYQFGQLLI